MQALHQGLAAAFFERPVGQLRERSHLMAVSGKDKPGPGLHAHERDQRQRLRHLTRFVEDKQIKGSTAAPHGSSLAVGAQDDGGLRDHLALGRCRHVVLP